MHHSPGDLFIARSKREIELVAICDQKSIEERYTSNGRVKQTGRALSITVSKPEDGLLRRTIGHDGTPAGLAGALDRAASWVREGCPDDCATYAFGQRAFRPALGTKGKAQKDLAVDNSRSAAEAPGDDADAAEESEDQHCAIRGSNARHR